MILNLGGGGVIHDPSGTEIPRGWGGLIGITIHGRGMDIFWNHTLFLKTEMFLRAFQKFSQNVQQRKA